MIFEEVGDMALHIPLRPGADPAEFGDNKEDFFTSLFAIGLLWARQEARERFKDVPVWWKLEEDAEGHHLGELLTEAFQIRLPKHFSDCPSIPDLALSDSGTLILVETKIEAPLQENQFKVICWLSKMPEETKAFLIMAPGGFGESHYHKGQLKKAHELGIEAGVKVGFLNLACTVNWACNILGLTALE
jgi:hypothetical protein